MSSSADAGDGSGDPKVLLPADTRDFEADPVPQSGRIFLDRTGPDTYQLTDLLSHARVVLKGTWELDDDNGRMIVVGEDSEGQPAYDFAEVVLGKDVYADGKGELFVVMTKGKSEGKSFSLDVHMSKYRDADINVVIGSTSAKTSLVGYVMAHPRDCGQRLFWGLFDLYGCLQLGTYSGQRCKWTNTGIPAWSRLLAPSLRGSHFIFSKHWNLGQKKVNQLPFHARCLPQPAVSTAALLRLLPQWAYATSAAGAFKDSESCKAAAQLFDSLTSLACSRHPDEVDEVPLAFDPDWVCRWPRPDLVHVEEDGSTSVKLFLRAPNLVNFKEVFEEQVESTKAHKVQRQWSLMMLKKGLGPDNPEVPIAQFVAAVIRVKPMSSLVAQLAIELAKRLDLVLADCRAGKSTCSGVDFGYRSHVPKVGDLDMEEKLNDYVSIAKEESLRHRVCSIATDKANPAYLPLQNSIISYPSGVAVLCCPQVERGFADEGLAEEVVTPQKAAKRPFETTPEMQADAKRQKAWMQRSKPEVQSKAWQPKTWHRVCARKWALAVDNQLRCSTLYGGLSYFRYKEDDIKWSRWQDWPCLGVSIDLGSDGVSGWCALAYGFEISTWLSPDASHSAQRSFMHMLRDVALYDFWLLNLISWNLEHGPHSDRGRHNQIREAMSTLIESRSPEQVPLFQQLCGAMAEELEAGGVITFPRDRPLEQEVWGWLRQRSQGGHLHRRVSTNRFGGTQHAAMKHMPFWSVELFERSFLALEMGWLGGREMNKKLVAKSANGGSASDGTHPRHLQVDDRALRGCCSNAVSISALTLDDVNNKRVVKSIIEAQRPLDKYHTAQNRTCRSSAETREWLTDQVCGGYSVHLREILGLLESPSSLMDASFTLPGVGGCSVQELRRNGEFDLLLGLEDEHSELFGQLVLSMLKNRAFRGLHFYGWPEKMVKVLHSDAMAQSAVSDFERDEKMWKRFVAYDGKTADAKAVQKRGVMNLVAVRQFSEAFSSTGFQATSDLKEVVRQRASVNAQTQIVEDLNGQQGNQSTVGQGRRFRKPSVCMASCLEQDIIGTRHRYKHPDLDAAKECSKQAKLPMDAFVPEKKSMSFDFSAIASTSPSAPWFSTSASNLMAPHSDMAMLHDAEAAGGFGLLAKAWLGEISDFKHHLALGFQNGDGSYSWFITLHYMVKSAAILWPVRRVAVEGTNFEYFEFDMDESAGIALKGIFTLEAPQVVAASYEWRSWLWQAHSLPASFAARARVAIRPFIDRSGVGPVQEVACRAGWWAMPWSSVSSFANYFNVNCDGGSSVTDLVWTMAQEVLGEDDDRSLEVLHRRMCYQEAQVEGSCALLEVDEAWDVIDPMDQPKVAEAQKQAKVTIASHQAYRAEYIAKAAAVRESGGNKRRKKAANTKKLILPEHHISQPEAKKFIPPASSVWRSLVRSEWCGHLPPHRRCTEPFARHGGSEFAFRALLRRLWKQHLDKVGQTAADCPIEGLFDDSE